MTKKQDIIEAALAGGRPGSIATQFQSTVGYVRNVLKQARREGIGLPIENAVTYKVKLDERQVYLLREASAEHFMSSNEMVQKLVDRVITDELYKAILDD